MAFTLKIAEIYSIDSIMIILDSARDYQRSLGFIQWEDGYPSEADIMRDVSNGIAHIFVEQGQIVGYVALAESDESYDSLTDTWQFGNDYGVVHRDRKSVV